MTQYHQQSVSIFKVLLEDYYISYDTLFRDMGNCGSKIDCAVCFNGGCNGTIDADADIVGPGVSSSLLNPILLRGCFVGQLTA